MGEQRASCDRLIARFGFPPPLRGRVIETSVANGAGRAALRFPGGRGPRPADPPCAALRACHPRHSGPVGNAGLNRVGGGACAVSPVAPPPTPALPHKGGGR